MRNARTTSGGAAARPRILLVTGECPWPSNHGGRLRTARIAEALEPEGSVTVTFPGAEEAAAPGQIELRPLVMVEPRRVASRLSVRPHLGARLGEARKAVAALLQHHELVVYSHSYLVPWASPPEGKPCAVDFANVEVLRQRSLMRLRKGKGRIATSFEAAKAPFWERGVARRADLALALSRSDADWLAKAGANVAMCPNGVERRTWIPSPDAGEVLLVGSFGYGPNRQAAEWFVGEVWPYVLRDRPTARLSLVGREARILGPLAAPSIRIHSDVPDTGPHYRDASVVVAPVTTGGGAQLKVVEAISWHRVVVATPYSTLSAPEGSLEVGICRQADGSWPFAKAILEILADAPRRHEVESRASEIHSALDWPGALAPLVRWVRAQSGASE